MALRVLSHSFLTLLCLPLPFVHTLSVSPLDTRDSALPSPLYIAPSGVWDGDDGTWSSFTLGLGTPRQNVRVFPSTTSPSTLVVLPQGCSGASNVAICIDTRGAVFTPSSSQSWHPIGIYTVSLETPLGYTSGDNAQFGNDTMTLALPGAGGPTLYGVTLGATAVLDYYLGIFGLDPDPTSFSANTSYPSYMTALKEQGLIPSLSFGYTAGANQYATGPVLASLVLGGTDRSRYQPNSLIFPFSSNSTRKLVVGLRGLYSSSRTGTFLSESIYMSIDSTVAGIYLPLDACAQMEQAFGLVYDNITGLYLLSGAQQAQLSAINPNITFTLAVDKDTGQAVDIVLSYSSFDLQASPPYAGLTNSSFYFPLHRASSPSMYTLGRTFLQEAYLAVDYERSHFTVSQAVFGTSPQSLSSIEPITLANSTTPGTNATSTAYLVTPTSTSPASTATQRSTPGISSGAIAGIVVGVVVALAAVTALLFFCCGGNSLLSRRRQETIPFADSKDIDMDQLSASDTSGGHASKVYPKAELAAETPPAVATLNGAAAASETSSLRGLTMPNSPAMTVPNTPITGTTLYGSPIVNQPNGPWPVEAGSKERAIYEMPGDEPKRSEMPIDNNPSEKELAIRRERLYNGVNPAERNIVSS